MLDSMRQAAGGWTAKVLLGLLVASFAVWGISGQFFDYGRGTLATVGQSEPGRADQRQPRQLTRSLVLSDGVNSVSELARRSSVETFSEVNFAFAL